MSWIVLVRAEAERDLEAAREWYERKVPGLGREFLDEFATAMQALEQDPERAAPARGRMGADRRRQVLY